MAVRAHSQYEIATDSHSLWLRMYVQGYRGAAINVIKLINDEMERRGAAGEPPFASPLVEPVPYADTREILQAILELAWSEGMRPSGFNDNEVSAVRSHLDDMRRLVFASFKIDEPKKTP